MSPEKWQQIKGQVQDLFKDAEILEAKLAEPEMGNKETLLFTGPLGKMKIEYITRPVILDKKTIGSRRIGSDTTVEYIYSNDEFSHTLKAYKWDEAQDDWLEIDLKESFSL
ncbi:MAG: hypothetical protein WC518_02415 [Patescibacteria group bacterium]